MSMNVVIVIVVIGVIAGDIATLWWFAKRFGAFVPLRPDTEDLSPLWLAYNVHSGPYQLIGPVCDGVYAALRDTYGIAAEGGFGLYFDNPRRVAKDQLRSIGGCVVPPDKAAGLTDKTLPFRMALLPQTRAVVMRFPFRGRASIMVGAMRAYPVLNRHFAEKGIPDGPMLEIYDVTEGEIRYIRPLDIADEDLERLL